VGDVASAPGLVKGRTHRTSSRFAPAPFEVTWAVYPRACRPRAHRRGPGVEAEERSEAFGAERAALCRRHTLTPEVTGSFVTPGRSCAACPHPRQAQRDCPGRAPEFTERPPGNQPPTPAGEYDRRCKLLYARSPRTTIHFTKSLKFSNRATFLPFSCLTVIQHD